MSNTIPQTFYVLSAINPSGALGRAIVFTDREQAAMAKDALLNSGYKIRITVIRENLSIPGDFYSSDF